MASLINILDGNFASHIPGGNHRVLNRVVQFTVPVPDSRAEDLTPIAEILHATGGSE
ncbi:hypothetical protein ACQP1G_20905 [Nocardia sp. CA-107356]|uniref:hypothetical protein n=1 Tax=Nocardia sp. CA-107356 TaxID=3239972 RepID=UPI003D9286D7